MISKDLDLSGRLFPQTLLIERIKKREKMKRENHQKTLNKLSHVLKINTIL